jgi:hypothetical protein
MFVEGYGGGDKFALVAARPMRHPISQQPEPIPVASPPQEATLALRPLDQPSTLYFLNQDCIWFQPSSAASLR